MPEVARYFFMMMYVLTRRAAGKDFQTGFNVSTENMGMMNKVEVDHIFPKSLLEGSIKSDLAAKKKMINEIANFGFLSKRGNLIKTNEAPEKYLPRLLKNKGPKVIKSHLIPADEKLWNLKNYKLFIEARRKLIASEINKLLKGYEQ
ncbi:MAG TPA: hypothetical protein VMR28_00655 [Candidatus Saccharimonadales bacterium]|nr:hypothetical protein [Candidatus Saccharimonadales bacterium]